ncbi:MAG TPA: hypothetical protein PLZ45_11105 [Ferruginibacter sp.]|nr:hypothetical protein [Ferruginibacter sp.]
MRFFSKITVLCNVCFMVYVTLWYVEVRNRLPGTTNQVIPLSWLENVFVILGFGSILVNTLFLLLVFIFTAFKVSVKIPRWIIIFNLAVFCAQVLFHFFIKQVR